MQSDLLDNTKIFPNSPNFPMENLLSNTLQNSSKTVDPSLKLKDFDQANTVNVHTTEKDEKTQPEVYASFRNPETEVVLNKDLRESERIKGKDGVGIPPEKTKKDIENSPDSVPNDLKETLDAERKALQSQEKMENDSIKFKNDTMQEENNHVKPELDHKNNTSIEIDTKGVENKENKDQIVEDSVKEKVNEKEQGILLPIINSPKKVAVNPFPAVRSRLSLNLMTRLTSKIMSIAVHPIKETCRRKRIKQPQIRNQNKNNAMQKITSKTQKTFAEDSRLNKSSIESRGGRYHEEPRLKFIEFEKGAEPRKKTQGTTNFLPFHLSKGTSNPTANNRNNSLPPLNNKGDESVTPSDNISRGSFIIAGNFQSANVSCIESQYNNKDNSPNDDESVDLTRLNNILRAKLKPGGSNRKLLEESEIFDTDNFIPKLYEKYMTKNNGKGFASNVDKTPYMDHLPNKGRGFSAKKGNERYLTKPKKPASLDKRQNLTENYTSDEDSTVMHSKNLQRLYNKSQGIPEELPPRLNTSENRTRSIKRVYNAAYLENKKPPKNQVQSIVKANINSSKNPFSLGAASNLIKPEVQATQEKSKRIASKTHLATPSNNPWDSMSNDKAKANVNSLTTNGGITKKRSSSVIGDIKGGQLTSNPSGVLTPKKSFKYLTQSRSGSEEKLARMDSHMLVRQAYRVKPKAKDDPNTSQDNSANRSITDASMSATRNYLNKLMKNNQKGARDKNDYNSSFDKKGMGFAKAQRTTSGLILEDTSPGPAYNLSGYKGILGTEKGLSLKDTSPIRSNSKANLREKPKEVVLLVNNKAVKTFHSQNGSEKSNNLTDRNKSVPKGVPFGKAKRDPLFGGSGGDAPGPGNYNLPKTKQSSNGGAAFGKEKRNFGDSLLKLKL